MDKNAHTFLPLFPLELVVFPGEPLKLHIFEPRYKELIRECHEKHSTFGIPTYAHKSLSEFGTEMTVEEVLAVSKNGEMDIQTRGLRVFRIETFHRHVPGHLYSAAEVTFFDPENDPVSTPVEGLEEEWTRFHAILGTSAPNPDFSLPNLSYRIASEVGLTLEQKMKLLGMDRELERQAYILEHLRSVAPLLEAVEVTKRRIRGNGHFLKPPPIVY